MTNDNDRKEFEAWALTIWGDFNPITERNLKDGGYHNIRIDTAWDAWQAARANSGWLPIESADKEQIEHILLYNGEYYVGGWANDRIGIGSEYLGYTGEGWYTDDWRKIESPTLWKPITPPKGEE